MTSEDYSGLKIEDMMKKIGILDIYKLNIYHVINLMFRVKNNTKPEAFENKFEIVHHHYPKRHSENNFIVPKINFKATKFAISLHGPRLWNSLTDKDTKAITSTPLSKRKLKKHPIKVKNITIFRNVFRYQTITSLNSLSHNLLMVVGHSVKILYNAASFLRCVSLF